LSVSNDKLAEWLNNKVIEWSTDQNNQRIAIIRWSNDQFIEDNLNDRIIFSSDRMIEWSHDRTVEKSRMITWLNDSIIE
jgi:hypothetical protein